MSARSKTAKNTFRRSLNPWLRPLPCGPINKNQAPKRRTGINPTLENFQKMIVDLNKKNASLREMVENIEYLQQQNANGKEENNEEEAIIDNNENERKQLISEFRNSVETHRKNLEKRLSRLDALKKQLSIFRFDKPEKKQPKHLYPNINPNIPSPRAHLRTCPRDDYAKNLAKAENDQLRAKTLYLERLLIVYKMKLKLFHDQRELSQLSKELSSLEFPSSSTTAHDFSCSQPVTPRAMSVRKNPRSASMRANALSPRINNEINEEIPNEEEEFTDFLTEDIPNDDQLKENINALKTSIEREKERIKLLSSQFVEFYEAATKIQKVWRGYLFRKHKNDKSNIETDTEVQQNNDVENQQNNGSNQEVENTESNQPNPEAVEIEQSQTVENVENPDIDSAKE